MRHKQAPARKAVETREKLMFGNAVSGTWRGATLAERPRMRWLLALVALLSACDLYWDHGSGDDVCNGPVKAPTFQLRNPDNGDCQTFDLGGCGCQPCAGGDILPNWATCPGPCEQITNANDCFAAASCHTAFIDGHFFGCWEVEPDRFTTGFCAGLLADDCTGRNDCVGLYTSTRDTSFQRCVAEPGAQCNSASDCAPGDFCDLSACPTCPSCDATCVGVCTAQPPPPPPPACSTLATEADCKARGDCEPIYDGQNCTCDPNGCTCQIETFAYCQPRQ